MKLKSPVVDLIGYLIFAIRVFKIKPYYSGSGVPRSVAILSNFIVFAEKPHVNHALQVSHLQAGYDVNRVAASDIKSDHSKSASMQSFK
jgi:hypothetical protein